MKLVALLLLLTVMPAAASPQTASHTDSLATPTLQGDTLGELTVQARHSGRRSAFDIGNTELIGTRELLRAACCNLGESFTTNPSVDVNYADAATGARQIRLLGLSGTYVQMLTENIPNLRGLASPFALSYIPGPWMQSIQVSKGASSVKNGYESITGQINVEYKKPQATPFADANLFLNSKGKLEANMGANLQLGNNWSAALMGHYELLDKAHDDNGDLFADMPKVRQGNLQARWAYMGRQYMMQAAVKGLKEHRQGGQTGHAMPALHQPYTIDVTNERYEAFAKNAVIIDPDHATNIALILAGSIHHEDALYGQRHYNAHQRNAYASLMLETDFNPHHSLSAGVSLNHDHLQQQLQAATPTALGPADETTPGAYAQYTYKTGETLSLMGGLRIDHSNLYGTFVTPRMHLKLQPTPLLTLRGSAGKGYRTPHPLAENNYLLASGRTLVVDDGLRQEEAWNLGLCATLNLPLGERQLQLSAEYYYTDFSQQTVADLDTDPHAIRFANLQGQSYSHTWQTEATYEPVDGLTITATYRHTNAKTTYRGVLREKPLTNRYKALLTTSFAPGLGLWQLDATLQLNGGGRMPDNHGNGLWDEHYPAYEQLSAQLTRFFRHWSIYAGAENLTNFRQGNPIIGADDPWDPHFDSTMIWGPLHGTVWYIGIRLNWTQL